LRKISPVYREIAADFLGLGLTAFGGPAVHLAQFRKRFVDEKKWLTSSQFLDLMGYTQCIPGPNSTEMAMHLGQIRGGSVGLWLAGIAFFFPAFCMVLLLSYLYTLGADLRPLQAALAGLSPSIIGVLVQPTYKLGKVSVKKVSIG
jgi:chromate transporter